MKTIYVNATSTRDLKEVTKKALEKLKCYQTIGLVTTSQHIKKLDEAAEVLKEHGKTPVVGGQILGCNIENAKKIEDQIDAFLYIGSGRFHPTAFYNEEEKTQKPVITANPYSGNVQETDPKERETWTRKQKARIRRTINAKTYGILLSTKTGQSNAKKAFEIKEKLKKQGKEAYILAGEEISPTRLIGIKVDALINTACPRIVDDTFEKPILNPNELETALELEKG